MSAHDMINTRPEFKSSLEKKMKMRLNGANHADQLLEYINNTKIPDWHFLPQTWFIRAVRVDCIVRLGVDDLINSLSKAGLAGWIRNFDSTPLNRSITSNVILTDDQKNEIRRIYSSDFKAFRDVSLRKNHQLNKQSSFPINSCGGTVTKTSSFSITDISPKNRTGLFHPRQRE